MIYKENGEYENYSPEGKKFTLKELQKAVGGLIEFVELYDGTSLVVNEEGLLISEPRINIKATAIRLQAYKKYFSEAVFNKYYKTGVEAMVVGNVLHVSNSLIR